MATTIGLTVTNNGDFNFFPILDDMDWQCADTVFFPSFDVDGNHTGRTPSADMIAAFIAWRNDHV
jgi:hypothetical protein